MKKFIYAALSLAMISSSALAMSHFAGALNAKGDEKNMKWSTTKWFDNGDFATKPLPSKPGANDSVTLKWGSYTLTADVDVNIHSFGIGDDSKFYAAKRNFKTKRDISIAISPYGESLMEFTDSNIDVGAGLKYNFWDKHMSAAYGTIKLVDSKMNVKNDLVVIIPSNGKFKNPERRGAKLEVVGKTILNFGGGAIIDSIITELPKEWMMRFTFKEKDGNIPMINFSKKAELTGCDFEFDLKNVKAGTYTLICFEDRKSGIGKPGRIVVNDQPYNLGDNFMLGGKSAKILLSPSPTSRDNRTANDLILQVSK